MSNIGNVYIADTNNARIRKVTISTGIITTVAGTYGSSFYGDNGDATSASMNPVAVALDSLGNSFVFYCFVDTIFLISYSRKHLYR